MNRSGRILILSALSLLSALAASGLACAEGKDEVIAPVTLDSVDGPKVKIDFAKAKVTVVNFWATWCVPCREEIPDIARIEAQYRKDGLQVFGVAMESGERSEVKDFLERNKRFGAAYPMLMGTDEVSDAFGGVMAVPTTYVLDAKGRVIRKFIGVTSDFRKTLTSDIQDFLGKTAGSAQTGNAAP